MLTFPNNVSKFAEVTAFFLAVTAFFHSTTLPKLQLLPCSKIGVLNICEKHVNRKKITRAYSCINYIFNGCFVADTGV